MTTGRINQVTVPRSLEPAPLLEQSTGRSRNRPGATTLPHHSTQEVGGPPGNRIQVLPQPAAAAIPELTLFAQGTLSASFQREATVPYARSRFPHAASTPRPRGQHFGTTIRLGTIFPSRPTLDHQCFGRPVKAQGGHGARSPAGT